MRRSVLVLLFLALLCLPGCSKGCGSGGAASTRTKVAVSIFPIYDLVRRIAGPDADVTLLLLPGKNEHTFDPTPKEIEEVAGAKLGVMVGLGLDPWMEKLMKDAAPTARLIKVGDRVPPRTIKDDPLGDDEAHKAAGKDDDHDHDKGAIDPHVWLDPQNASLIVKAVVEELAKVDSAHANDYRKRAAEIDASLDLLDKEVLATTKAWKTRGFITFHGSFGYFAARYDLSIVAVIEPFPGSTPTGAYISKVLDVVKEKKVPALFSEPQLDPRPAKVLADEAKIPLGVLDPVGGNAGTETYEKMIRYDVAELEKFLK